MTSSCSKDHSGKDIDFGRKAASRSSFNHIVVKQIAKCLEQVDYDLKNFEMVAFMAERQQIGSTSKIVEDGARIIRAQEVSGGNARTSPASCYGSLIKSTVMHQQHHFDPVTVTLSPSSS